ncbi:CDP-alcohol phosphatidyltransferase family protein [Nocardioides sp.]|uniref:CDP-alcohol phosphatidyltransferase family protein n=1 Tax=Nocardioides sp. TaxID=35761 RepID=UPI0039E32731
MPFYTRVVNRRLGRVFAAAAATRRLSPNAVSVGSAVLWAAALVVLCLVPTTLWSAVAVVALLVLSFGLDAADGQLARLTGRSGRAGEWLDHVLDAGRHVAVHLAVAVALYRFTDLSAATLLIPLGFATVSSTRFVAQVLAEQLRPASATPSASPAASLASSPAGSRGGALLQLPADTGVLNASLLLLPAPTVFVVVYGLLALANAGLLVATMARRFTELSRLDRAAVRS